MKAETTNRYSLEECRAFLGQYDGQWWANRTFPENIQFAANRLEKGDLIRGSPNWKIKGLSHRRDMGEATACAVKVFLEAQGRIVRDGHKSVFIVQD